MTGLILNLVLLVIGVGGAIVSALALENPVHRVRCVRGFAALGLVGFVLTVVAYEQTAGVPHLADAIAWAWPPIAVFWATLIRLVWRPSVGILAALMVGLVLGPASIYLYSSLKRRTWYSSYDIFKLADQTLMKDVEVAEEDIQNIADRILALGNERRKLGHKPDGSIDIVSSELEILSASTREASAKSLAAHELREKARRKALQDVYNKLTEGRLLAKGFKDPLGINPKETQIEASYWKFLKFSGDYKDAEGKGLKFTGIEVAKK